MPTTPSTIPTLRSSVVVHAALVRVLVPCANENGFTFKDAYEMMCLYDSVRKHAWEQTLAELVHRVLGREGCLLMACMGGNLLHHLQRII